VANNFPELASVTSEALQQQIRSLLPSQEGFGTDLMAQNVIVPIVDLTAAAEGSSVRQDLQSSIAFGSQTAFSVNNQTSTIINATGFWRIIGIIDQSNFVVGSNARINMTDGLSTKIVYQSTTGGSGDTRQAIPFDFIFFLTSGESITMTAATASITIAGSYRQIADINGTLVNPVGFNPQ
jgi:hypothetical protein